MTNLIVEIFSVWLILMIMDHFEKIAQIGHIFGGFPEQKIAKWSRKMDHFKKIAQIGHIFGGFPGQKIAKWIRKMNHFKKIAQIGQILADWLQKKIQVADR